MTPQTTSTAENMLAISDAQRLQRQENLTDLANF